MQNIQNHFQSIIFAVLPAWQKWSLVWSRGRLAGSTSTMLRLDRAGAQEGCQLWPHRKPLTSAEVRSASICTSSFNVLISRLKSFFVSLIKVAISCSWPFKSSIRQQDLRQTDFQEEVRKLVAFWPPLESRFALDPAASELQWLHLCTHQRPRRRAQTCFGFDLRNQQELQSTYLVLMELRISAKWDSWKLSVTHTGPNKIGKLQELVGTWNSQKRVGQKGTLNIYFTSSQLPKTNHNTFQSHRCLRPASIILWRPSMSDWSSSESAWYVEISCFFSSKTSIAKTSESQNTGYLRTREASTSLSAGRKEQQTPTPTNLESVWKRSSLKTKLPHVIPMFDLKSFVFFPLKQLPELRNRQCLLEDFQGCLFGRRFFKPKRPSGGQHLHEFELFSIAKN